MRDYTRQMTQNSVAINMMQNQLNSKSIEVDVVNQEYSLRKLQLLENISKTMGRPQMHSIIDTLQCDSDLPSNYKSQQEFSQYQ